MQLRSALSDGSANTVLFTPGLSCKTAGVTGMDDIKPLFMTDIGSDLVHVS
ncbi:MAG: hypothetical protein SPK77_09595 [Lachnospiraceae bacterium]|nr:hypothetical protein [Lachnospiraceae bacterium]